MKSMDIWKEALKRGVQIDDNNVIYKGVKFVMTEFSIEVYTTETDFYEEMEFEFVKLFYEEGFDYAISAYLYDKYVRQIEDYNRRIRYEVGGRNNSRKYQYLKNQRDSVLEKLNYERNTRETKE
jgi:hypothetical protein